MSGNGGTIVGDDTELFTKKTSAIIPFFSELYRECGILNVAGVDRFVVKENHEDQVLTLEHITKKNMKVKNILGVRDPIKKRFYNLTEIKREK